MSDSIVVASGTKKFYNSEPRLPQGYELEQNCMICGKPAKVVTQEEKEENPIFKVCSQHLGR